MPSAQRAVAGGAPLARAVSQLHLPRLTHPPEEALQLVCSCGVRSF